MKFKKHVATTVKSDLLNGIVKSILTYDKKRTYVFQTMENLHEDIRYDGGLVTTNDLTNCNKWLALKPDRVLNMSIIEQLIAELQEIRDQMNALEVAEILAPEN